MQPNETEHPTNETPITPTGKKRQSHAATVVAIIVSLILVCLIGVGVWGLATGKLVLATNVLDKSSKGYQIVCGDDLVNKFNKAVYVDVTKGSKVSGIDTSALKSLEAQIKQLKGYKDDPTCQTLIFWSDIDNYNYDGAKAAYQAVKQQHAEGKYPNNDIYNNQAVSTYDIVLGTIMPEPKNAPKH